MSALPVSDREHLARLLGLLGSDFAGERDAAGLAAARFVKQRGLTWHDVLDVANQPERTKAAGWRDLVAQCRAQPGCLRPWERDFLCSLHGFPRCSPKQAAILRSIAERLGLGRAAA